MRYLAILFSISLYAQTPAITGVGADSITTTSARVYWTAGFYHDATTDTTLTDGFTSGATSTIHVGSTANWKGWVAGDPPTTFIMNGLEWGRVSQVVDATHANIEMTLTGFGGEDATGEGMYQTRSGALRFVVSSNVATVTTYYPLPPWWITGHHLLIFYARTSGLTSSNYVISSVIDSTHFQMTTSGVADGTYDVTTDPDLWLESNPSGTVHSGGETISMLGTDQVVCYGSPGGNAGTYPNSVTLDPVGFQRVSQSSKHYVYLMTATPGSTIHYIVLSTPRQYGVSNCSSIGAHTGQSSDQTLVFPATEQTTPIAPTGVSFSTAVPVGCDSVTTASNCSDLQTKINAARAVVGCHYIKIPAGSVCTAPIGGWTIPPQTNGSTVLNIRTSASDASLPIPGACLAPLNPATATPATSPCIDNPSYSGFLATLQTSNTPITPIFSSVAYQSTKDVHIGPGLKLQSDPHYAYQYGSTVALIDWGQTQGNGNYQHASHPSNVVHDRLYFYQKNLSQGARAAINWAGGNSIAVVDSVATGLGNVGQDFGLLNLADQDLVDGGYIIKNNRMQGGSMVIYMGDSGWNTKNGVIQKNWLYADQSWRRSSPTYLKQRSYPVTSATAGGTTAIVLTDEADINVGYSNPFYFNFVGGTGNWTPLNVKEFFLTDGSLTDFNCDGTNCISTTGASHGLSTGNTIYVSGLANVFPCNFEVGAHTITVTDATHFQYLSSNTGRCIYPDVHVMGPVFLPSSISDNTHFVIALNSTGFGALTGTVTARVGFTVDFKNIFECKTCALWDISGNIAQGAFAGSQEGQCFTISNRIAGTFQDIANVASLGTIADMNIHDNWCKDSTMMTVHLGVQDNGSSIPMNRVSISNNLGTGLNNIYCEAGATCGNYTLNFADKTLNFIHNHNTIIAPTGIMSPSGGLTPPAVGNNWQWVNNIMEFGGNGWQGPSNSSGTQKFGGQVYQLPGTTCSNGGAHDCSLPFPPWPSSAWVWGRNAVIGNLADSGLEPWNFGKQYYDQVTAGDFVNDYQSNYWPIGTSGVAFNGFTAISAASNPSAPSPVVLTTSAMSCVPAIGDLVEVSGVTGNLGANGTYNVLASGSTSLTLQGSLESGVYAGGGNVLALTGLCGVTGNWALGSSSLYRAGVAHISPQLNTPGQGPALDGFNVGVDINHLNASIAGCTITPSTLPNTTIGATYNQTVFQAGCNASSFTLISGSLPNGLALNSTTGNIGGIVAGPTATYNFTVGYDSASQPYTVVVSGASGSGILTINGSYTVRGTFEIH